MNRRSLVFITTVRYSVVLATVALSLVQTRAASTKEWPASHVSGGLKGIVELSGGVLVSARWTHKAALSSIIAVRSTDHGNSWADEATVLTAPPGTDVGDGNLVLMPHNQILLCYRYNQHAAGKPVTYSIGVHQSGDGGLTWHPHSTVTHSTSDTPRGLWAPFLFMTHAGHLLCFYDDEQTPEQDGFDHQQYVSAKRWNPAQRQWTDRRTVCRAHDQQELSRDGMATVVQLSDGRLIATVESVRRQPPHTNVIRSVSSIDDGDHWDWQTREPPVLYAPKDPAHLAVSPWLILLRRGGLACFFSTDEDQPQTVRPGSLPSTFNTDIKVIFSRDGEKWSTPTVVYAGHHRAYMPAAFETVGGDGQPTVLVQALDFGRSPPRVQLIHPSNRAN